MHFLLKFCKNWKKYLFFDFAPTLLTKKICKTYHFYLDKCRHLFVMYALNLKNKNVLKYKWVTADRVIESKNSRKKNNKVSNKNANNSPLN